MINISRLSRSGILRLFFSFSLVVNSDQLTGQIQHINFRHYSLADGLSSYKVVKILQDRFGFMWIATQDGLNRFDGKGIIIYNKSAREKHLLLGSDITDMLEDTSRNLLWVITSYGGLNGIDLKTGAVKFALSVADSSHLFPNSWLKAFIQNGDDLWIGTQEGITIYDVRQQKLKKTIIDPFQKNKLNNYGYEFDINLFYKDETGRIWAFVKNGLVIFSGDDYSVISSHTLVELRLPEGRVWNKRFNSCVKVVPGQMLLATHKGLIRIIYDKSGLINISGEAMPGFDNEEIRFLNHDPGRNLWFATNEGLYKKAFKDGIISAVEDVNRVDQKKWTNSVNTIFFDRDQNLWLGTLQGFAMASKTQSPFLNFFQSADLKTKISRAFFIFPYNDSVEYVCAEDGFYRVDNTVKNIQRLKEGNFWYMFRHQDDKLILCADNRIFVFQPPSQFTEIERIYPELTSISHETIVSVANWKDSLLFLGIQLGSPEGNGIYVWDHKKKILEKLNNKSPIPLKSGIVNAIYKDKLDKIWVLSDTSFAVYDPVGNQLENQELSDPDTKQPLTLFFDMCEAFGSYWLASYGSGIVQIDDKFNVKKIISTSEGMNNAGVYKVFAINDTFLLSTSNNGLSKINIQNFLATNYFESDGLHSNAFEEMCGTTYKGKIYAGGPDGFTIIDPKYISVNKIPPELYINNIVIETKEGRQEISDLYLETVKLHRNLLQATVYFSGLSYSNPERTTYAYRIKQQHEEWIKLGTQNFVNLIGLKPGAYTLQVKAFNEDGLAGKVKEIQLIFLPKWYQTLWFKALGIIFIVLGIYALYRYRINQIREQVEIRKQIAGDLHDDIGSTLNSIKVFSNLALMKPENEEYLMHIKEGTQDAITGIRDIMWVLDDKLDTVSDVINRFEHFARPLAEANQVELVKNIDPALVYHTLKKEEKRNLYLILKEAFNNCIKYAECRQFNYSFKLAKAKKITVQVKDNGKGFDVPTATQGNGLKNMKERAEQISYKFSVDSSSEKGTIIEVSQA